jgi:P-type conjugative transfer protein TrbJ
MWNRWRNSPSRSNRPAQQIANQVEELAHLDVSIAPNDSGIIAGIQAQFDTSLYHTASPGNQLDSRFPTDMSSATWTQYQSDETTWTADERQSLTENRQAENQVYQDMQTTQQQVQAIVDASNSAPGETAAVQAHNNLLSVASAELAKLQALKTARSRLRTEQLARQQSEAAFATAGTRPRPGRLEQPGAADGDSRRSVPELTNDQRRPTGESP